MSRWVRGIYNSAANFVLSGSLRAASGRTMDRRSKHLSKESNQSDQCDKSCESSESVGCTPATCSCAGTTPNAYRIPCRCSRTSASGSRSTTSTSANTKDGDLPNPHGTSCSCPSCRSYADYLAATGTKGQGACTRVRDSIESRYIKQADADSTDSIERRIGIPAGVTV